MKFNFPMAAASVLVWALFPLEARADYKLDSPAVAVATIECNWHDSVRNRDVPAKIYYPEKSDGPCPVIIFSHGLGGSRAGYQFLGEYWASHGYISVHVQHIGSDDSVWRNALEAPMQAMSAAAANPMNAVDRCKDVTFAIDQIEKLNADESSALKGKMDLSKIGMAGHSFGALTAMSIGGMAMVTPVKVYSFGDERVKAAIAMSPPVPREKANYAASYDPVKIPVFVMTGTEDNSPIGKTTAVERRAAFDYLKHAPAYLLTFDGGDHMVFSGRRLGGEKPTDAPFHELILRGSTAFWDAYLRGNADAKEWLAGGGFEKAVGKEGVFELKK